MSIQTLPTITTKRLILRVPQPDDAALVFDYFDRNREHLEPYEPARPPGFYSEDYWRQVLERYLEDFRNDRAFRVILLPRDKPGRVVGMANFTNILRRAAYFCTLGYSIDRLEEGRGLMREALEPALEYVFDSLNLHRVMANYMPRNERSGGLLKRLGFVVEGYARDYLRINGRWEDHILASLVNPSWCKPD